MLGSAKLADVSPRALSFKHTVQLWRSWRATRPQGLPPDDLINPLLRLIAQRRVGKRPGRIEPRAVKRRPKAYGLLMLPKVKARASIRQSGHPSRKHGESIQSLQP